MGLSPACALEERRGGRKIPLTLLTLDPRCDETGGEELCLIHLMLVASVRGGSWQSWCLWLLWKAVWPQAAHRNSFSEEVSEGKPRSPPAPVPASPPPTCSTGHELPSGRGRPGHRRSGYMSLRVLVLFYASQEQETGGVNVSGTK